MSRVHHVFVRDRASGVWAHETAFADRRDAEAERDDYRDKPTTRAVRIIAGPGAGAAHFAWIARKVAELNGPTTTAADVEAMRAADDRRRRRSDARRRRSLAEGSRMSAHLIAICSNKPRASTATAKGNQWWRREVYHIAAAGDAKASLCGRDASDWLTIGPIEALDDQCCERCAKLAPAVSS